jgi:hypothetical protein
MRVDIAISHLKFEACISKCKHAAVPPLNIMVEDAIPALTE